MPKGGGLDGGGGGLTSKMAMGGGGLTSRVTAVCLVAAAA